MQDDSLTLAQAESGVTPEERAFILAVVQDEEMSVANAEKKCGLPAASGHRLLRRAHIRRYMAAVLADRRQRYADIRDGVIQALWSLATYDIKDAIDTSEDALDRMPETLDEALSKLAGGRLKPPHELPPELRAAVVSVKLGERGWEYKFTDRSKILLNLLKHFGAEDAIKAGSSEAQPGVVIETKRVIYYSPQDVRDVGQNEEPDAK